jgi:hypothetical protein
MGLRYVSPEMAPATLRARKVLYQWLGATQRTDGDTVLRIMEIGRGNGTNADRYVMHLMTKLDDPDLPPIDVVLLPDADPDDDDEGVWFDTAEEALQHACAGGGARSDRFVIGGTISDEFLDYLRWNGRAPV